MRNKVYIAILLLFRISFVEIFAQTYTVSDIAPFATTNKSMWGPSGSFTFNKDIEIFRFNPATINSSVGSISTVSGAQFGAELFGKLDLDIGSNFVLSDFSGGSIDVDYPVQINHTIPADLSFEKGEWISIPSDYNLQGNAKINSQFPHGSAELNFHFGFATNVHANFCFFSCNQLALLPPNSTTATIGPWPSAKFTLFGLYYNKTTGTYNTKYPCLSALKIPMYCNDNDPSISLNFPPLGLSGSVSIPSTQTTSSINGKCLRSSGEDKYLQLDIDLLTYLSKAANLIPPPAGTAIALLVDNLNNSYSLPGGASVSYSVFSADFSTKDYNKQKFTYCPKVNTTMNFPINVLYRIKESGSGTIKDSGYNSDITYATGDILEIKYPCNYEFLDVSPVYNMDTLENNFRNQTYDSISFSFDMAAIAFSFDIPYTVIVPALTVPGLCIDYYVPCPTLTNPFKFCSAQNCTNCPCTTPEVSYGPYNTSLGPLWSKSIPLDHINVSWFDQTWPLKGFDEIAGTPFVLRPRPYSVSVTGTDILCKNDQSGSIVATVTNGTPPYIYEWDNNIINNSSSTTNSVNNLEAGVHFVKVTNANGCSDFASYTITEPIDKLSIIDINIQNVSCFDGNDGGVTVTVNGGTLPYSYNWSNGVSSSSLSNVISSTYSLTITDRNNCTIDTIITINQPDNILISSIIKDVKCSGESSGMIATAIAGGNPPFTYAWSSGATTSHITNVSGGNYTVTATDLNGCIKSESFEIIDPPPLTITSLIATNVNCYEGNDGSILSNVSGGVSPYSFNWYNSSGKQLNSFINSVKNLPTDTYKLIVNDTNGCSAMATTLVDQPAKPLTISFSVSDVNCRGGNDGQIDLLVSGGTPSYTFNWSNGALTEDVSNLTPGLYNVTVTDNNLCTVFDSALLNEPLTHLSSSTKTNDVSCFGGSNGTIDLSVIGGTPPYTYSWSNGATTQNLDSLSVGNYSVTIHDANGCNNTAFGFIDQPDQQMSISTVIDSVTCHGFSNGKITISVMGGTSPYEYQWADSAFLLSKYNHYLENIEAGNYAIIITDSNRCVLRKEIEVFEPDTLTLLYNTSDVNCYNGNDGAIDLEVNGGTLPYSYIWNDSIINRDRDKLTKGIYMVTVSDFHKCILTDSIEIFEPDDIILTGRITEISCKEASDGTIRILASGGTGNFIYQWAHGQLGDSLSNLSSGKYEVYVTDENACTDTLLMILNPSEAECIQIANTFTPDGDGINDTWIIDNLYLYPDAEVSIYNEWGKLIYTSSKNYNPWDGTYNGNPLPTATYYYILNLGNGSRLITGTITIIR